MALRAASCAVSSLSRMERPRGFILRHAFRGQWPEKPFSYAVGEASAAPGGHWVLRRCHSQTTCSAPLASPPGPDPQPPSHSLRWPLDSPFPMGPTLTPRLPRGQRGQSRRAASLPRLQGWAPDHPQELLSPLPTLCAPSSHPGIQMRTSLRGFFLLEPPEDSSLH